MRREKKISTVLAIQMSSGKPSVRRRYLLHPLYLFIEKNQQRVLGNALNG